MARLFSSGCELGVSSAEWVAGQCSGTPTLDTTHQYSGRACWACACSAQTCLGQTFNGGVSTTYYFQFRIQFVALPTTNAAFPFGMLNASTFIGELSVGTGGALLYRINGGVTLITGPTLTTGQWYRIELAVTYPASGASTVTLKVDGAVSGSTGSGSATVPTAFRVGGHVKSTTLPGAGSVYVDDILLNDSTGSDENSWVDDQRITMLYPVADGARGSWTGGAGGTTSLFAAIDNLPPVGVAVASQNDSNQIKDAATGTTDSYTPTLGALTATRAAGGGGLSGSEQITSVRALGAGATGTTTNITFGIAGTTNPVIAESTSTTGTTTASAYPTAWTLRRTAYAYKPWMQASVGPTITIRKGTNTANTLLCCVMGMEVCYRDIGSTLAGLLA